MVPLVFTACMLGSGFIGYVLSRLHACYRFEALLKQTCSIHKPDLASNDHRTIVLSMEALRRHGCSDTSCLGLHLTL